MVYTTTFRGVRSTFEECKYVLAVFHNLRVRVEERDIYVHKFYLKELEDRLQGGRCSVPQVFISGQHIGVSLTDTSLTHSFVIFPIHNVMLCYAQWCASTVDTFGTGESVLYGKVYILISGVNYDIAKCP